VTAFLIHYTSFVFFHLQSADTIAQELAGESADLAKAAKAQVNSAETKKDE
jgi:hypothetical protein